MRRLSFLIPFFALVAGCTGCYLRKIQLDTIFDNTTGLSQTSAPVTLEIFFLSVGVALCALIVALAVTSRYKAPVNYEQAFSFSGFGTLVISSILGLSVCAFSIYSLYLRFPSFYEITLQEIGLTFFEFLSGISVIVMAIDAYKGKRSSFVKLFSVIPSLFFCFWMLLIYKENSRNPVLLDYSYQCIGFGMACLSFFYNAGFLFESIKVRFTILFNILGIFFCALILADYFYTPEFIIIAAFALVQVFNLSQFLKNLSTK